MPSDKHAAWMAALLERGPASIYKRHNDILRDRRLNDEDRIRLLDAWPSADDFERGEVARAKQEVMARIAQEKAANPSVSG